MIGDSHITSLPEWLWQIRHFHIGFGGKHILSPASSQSRFEKRILHDEGTVNPFVSIRVPIFELVVLICLQPSLFLDLAKP